MLFDFGRIFGLEILLAVWNFFGLAEFLFDAIDYEAVMIFLNSGFLVGLLFRPRCLVVRPCEHVLAVFLFKTGFVYGCCCYGLSLLRLRLGFWPSVVFGPCECLVCLCSVTKILSLGFIFL